MGCWDESLFKRSGSHDQDGYQAHIWKQIFKNLSLRCPHDETLGPQLPIERTAKTLIRLG